VVPADITIRRLAVSARVVIAAIVSVWFVACGARRPLAERQPCPCAQGWSCDLSQDTCVPDAYDGGSNSSEVSASAGDGGGAVPAHYSAAEVQSALAACDRPHGPPVDTATPNEEHAKLVGTWLLCPPASSGPLTMFAPGIRFEANGNFETLAMNSDGGLTPGVGLLSQGQWATSCYNTDNTVPDVNARPCPGTSFYGILASAHTVGGDDSPANCFVGPITFETSPARGHVIDWPALWCTAAYQGDPFDLWLVPLP
jgi:hypothetical protein